MCASLIGAAEDHLVDRGKVELYSRREMMDLVVVDGKDGATGRQTGAIVITGEEADRLLRAADIPDPELFYRQGLGLARYMMETSGNPAIFGAIAEGLASGETMESWLAADGAAAADFELARAMSAQ